MHPTPIFQSLWFSSSPLYNILVDWESPLSLLFVITYVIAPQHPKVITEASPLELAYPPLLGYLSLTLESISYPSPHQS